MQNELNAPIMWWSGDEAEIRELLLHPTSTGLKNLLGNTKSLVVDEVQRIENIGITIKLIVDQIKNIKVIATGSSACELSNKMNPLLEGNGNFSFSHYLMVIWWCIMVY